MRLYPLASLRDWRAECERSQARADERRQCEPFVPSWPEALVSAAIVMALLKLALIVGG